MRLPAASLLVILLAGCADPTADLSDAEALAAYVEAAEAGDTGRMLDVLTSRARGGDQMALFQLADVYERERLPVPEGVEVAPETLVIWTWPWEAPLWRARAETRLREGLQAGDPEALLRHASELTSPRFEARRWREPDPDEKAAGVLILKQLAAAGNDQAMLRLAFLSPTPFGPSAETPESTRWMRRAAAAGNPQACALLVWKDGFSTRSTSAPVLAKAVDRLAACDTLHAPASPWSRPRPPSAASVESVRSLREQAALGNPVSAALLDSLRALGVFERHPRLAADAS